MACGRFSRPREVKKLVPVPKQELIALRPLIIDQALELLGASTTLRSRPQHFLVFVE